MRATLIGSLLLSLIAVGASAQQVPPQCTAVATAGQYASQALATAQKNLQRAQRNYDNDYGKQQRTINRYDTKINKISARIEYLESYFKGSVVAVFLGGNLTAQKGAEIKARIESYREYRKLLRKQRNQYQSQTEPIINRDLALLDRAKSNYDVAKEAYDEALAAYLDCVNAVNPSPI